MTHWRQEILGATTVRLIAGETAAAERVYQERAETLAFPSVAAAEEGLPAICVYLPRAKRTFAENPSEGRGDGTLQIEVVATGADGAAAGAARDALCDEVEAILSGDRAGPLQYVERIASIEDEATIGRDGVVLLSVAKLSVGFSFTATAATEPEDDFEGADEDDDVADGGGPDEVMEQTFPLDPEPAEG